MKIFRHIEDQGLPVSGTVATMGNFDGIHLGHQALVRIAQGQLNQELRRRQFKTQAGGVMPGPGRTGRAVERQGRTVWRKGGGLPGLQMGVAVQGVVVAHTEDAVLVGSGCAGKHVGVVVAGDSNDGHDDEAPIVN